MIVEEQVAVARQRRSKHVSAATMEELLEAMLSVWSAPRL
jgi:hypothetical protein